MKLKRMNSETDDNEADWYIVKEMRLLHEETGKDVTENLINTQRLGVGTRRVRKRNR